MLQIGLIGYGAFGQLIAQHLASVAEFHIYDPTIAGADVTKALAQPIIILAIPAQELAGFLSTNSVHLHKDALYIDVCSVKVRPVSTLLEHVPETAQIIATHPMFGPATAADSLVGRKIMIHPVRVSDETYQTFKQFLAGFELSIIETTPEKHDHMMAYVQGLSHYIGRIMQEMDVPNTELSTLAYDDLLDMKRVQGNDSDALFNSILHENPYTKEVLEDFETAQKAVDSRFSV
jgi:prephenate dehydrogenase